VCTCVYVCVSMSFDVCYFPILAVQGTLLYRFNVMMFTFVSSQLYWLSQYVVLPCIMFYFSLSVIFWRSCVYFSCTIYYCHCLCSMQSRVYKTVRCPSVCLSYQGPTAANPLLQVYCCAPSRREISIDCCSSGRWMRAVPRCQHTYVAEQGIVCLCLPVSVLTWTSFWFVRTVLSAPSKFGD